MYMVVLRFLARVLYSFKKFSSFAIADRPKPRSREWGRDAKHYKRKRLSALILDHQKFSQNFKLQSRCQATVDARGM